MSDDFYYFIDDFESRANISKKIFFFLLKIAFIMIACLWILRLGANLDNVPVSFSDILNYINNCPNFYDTFIDRLLSNVYYTGSTDTINLPIIGGFLTFLGNLWNILVYACGCIVVSISYLGYIFGVIFQF